MNIVNKSARLLQIFMVVAAILTAPISAIAAELVDINRADAATMIENWQGIGKVKADAIVAYRKKNGKFASIEDLANVKGVGEGLIKKNRKLMSVSKGISKPTGKSTTAKSSTTKKSSNSSKDKKSTASKSVASKKETKKSSSKKSSKSKSSTKTTSKSKKKKTTDCKPGSKDKKCKKKKSKKKKAATT